MTRANAIREKTTGAYWQWLALAVALGTAYALPFAVCLGLVLVVALASVLIPNRFFVFLITGLFVLVVDGRELTHNMWRPWFYNSYGRNDRMWLNRWRPGGGEPGTDLDGNVLAGDFKANVLLLVMAPATTSGDGREQFGYRAWHGIMFEGDRAGVPVHCGLGQHCRIEMKGCSDRLIVFLADGTRMEAPLGPGRAEDLMLEKRGAYVLSLLRQLDPRTEAQAWSCVDKLREPDAGTSQPA